MGKTMSEALFNKMADFYEANPIAQEMTRPLKDGAEVEVHFENDDETYTVIKEKGRAFFRQGKPEKPQLYCKYSEDAAAYILSAGDSGLNGVQDFVGRVSECILCPTRERYIELRLCASVITLLRKGYFGMVFVGGSRTLDVARNVANMLGIKIPDIVFKKK